MIWDAQVNSSTGLMINSTAPVSPPNQPSSQLRTIETIEKASEAEKQKRVTIWNKKECRKIVGNAAPMSKNLQQYLKKHTDCEVYVGQDKFPENQKRIQKMKEKGSGPPSPKRERRDEDSDSDSCDALPASDSSPSPSVRPAPVATPGSEVTPPRTPAVPVEDGPNMQVCSTPLQIPRASHGDSSFPQPPAFMIEASPSGNEFHTSPCSAVAASPSHHPQATPAYGPTSTMHLAVSPMESLPPMQLSSSLDLNSWPAELLPRGHAHDEMDRERFFYDTPMKGEVEFGLALHDPCRTPPLNSNGTVTMGMVDEEMFDIGGL